MTERMKDHLRQSCVLTELCKLFEDDPILAGPSIGKCYNQIEVLILVTQEAFQLVLGLLPFPQDVSQRFRQPHLTDAGIGFRLFQNNSCAGVRHERSEDVIDILLTQRFNRPFGSPRQLLVDVDIRPKSFASLTAASLSPIPNSFAVRSTASPVAPQPKQ